MFKFLLVLEDDEPNDPALFLTAGQNWRVDELFMTGDGASSSVASTGTRSASSSSGSQRTDMPS